jgi:hypothetical protein
MNEHADLDLIAAFREGLLDRAGGDRVGRHLSDCAACAQRQAALDEVTARLAQAPAPPMPPALARRLDAALAAEVAAAKAAAEIPAVAANAAGEQRQQRTGHGHRADHSRAGRDRAGHKRAGRAPAGRQPTGRGPAGRERADRERSVRGLIATTLRPLAVAASVCLLVGGGYLLVHSFTQNSANPPVTAAGSPSAKSGSALSPRRPMIAPQNPTAGAAVVYVHSGTRYEPGQLRAQATAVARVHADEVVPGKAGDTTVKPSGQNSSLSGCVQRVTGG